MLYIDKKLIKNSRMHAAWWDQTKLERQRVANMERLVFGNQAALIPGDAWREVDAGTKEVMRLDDGEAILADLMPLAQAVDIGKMAVANRVASTAGKVGRSLTGKTPTDLDKVEYDFQSSLIPIFHTGYSRAWREVTGMQSEGFDALRDDDRETKISLRSDMARYIIDGDASLNFEGVTGAGIRTSPYSKAINIGAAGANIDLTAADGDATMAFIEGAFTSALIQNKITGGVVLVVSPEIAQNFDKSDQSVLLQAKAGQWGPGTIGSRVESSRRIEKVIECSLLTGNEFLAYKRSPDFIRPRVGMAATTIPKVRINVHDDFEFLSMAAMGLQIKADFHGNTGVFYSVTA